MSDQIDRTDLFTASFVPRSVAETARLAENGPTSRKPSRIDFDAAIAFVDISGFTPITEQFERIGPNGIEQLNTAVARVFGTLIDAICESGGEIADIPGDAILAYWPARDGAVGATVHRATTALASAIEHLTRETTTVGVPFQVHTAMASGPVAILQLGGGETGHRLAVLVGDAVDRAIRLANRAAADEFLLDAQCAALLVDAAALRRETGDIFAFVSLTRAAGKIDIAPLPTDAALHHYVQPGLRERIAARQEAWLAEYRKVSSVFISVRECSFADDASLAHVHRITTIVQDIVHRHGGTTQSVTLYAGLAEYIVLFGLPMRAHENDAYRAVAAACMIDQQLSDLNLTCCIAVCSGPIYCGLIGNDIWRGYAMHGTVMNRASRVMQLGHPGVTIDEQTRDGATNRVTTRALPSTRLKGVREPVHLYAIEDQQIDVETFTLEMAFGRGTEVVEIGRAIQSLKDGSQTRVVVVEGVPGIGKTMLLREAVGQAREQGLTALYGQVDNPVFADLFSGWRGVFQDLFSLRPNMSADDAMRNVEAMLPPAAAALRRAPLLTPVLPFAIPNNDLTREMTGDARASNAQDLMLAILQAAAEKAPIVIVLDDFERMDTASLKLAEAVAEHGHGMLLLIGVRMERDRAETLTAKFLSDEATVHLPLSDVEGDGVVEKIIADNLGVTSVAPVVTEYVRQRAGGNPFFIRELSAALHEQGFIQVEGGRCGVAAGVGRLTDISFPDTIERVILSRIDKLKPEVQFTLKIASVLGRQFELREVEGVHPLNLRTEECMSQVDELAQRQLTPLLRKQPQRTYFFKHVITHRTVYGLLAVSDRRELHRMAAEWIESVIQDPLVTHSAILAHHWLEADDPGKALDYLEAAGFQALNANADIEGLTFLSRSVEIMKSGGAIEDPVRAARNLFGLAEIDMRLGNVRDSERCFREGLGLLGLDWPRSKIGLFAGLLQAAAIQFYHRLAGMTHDPGKPVNPDELLKSAGLQKFGYVFFFEDRSEEMVLGILHGLNAADRSNNAAAIARSSGLFSVVLCVMRLHRWAESYARRSRKKLPDFVGLTSRSYIGNFSGLYALGRGQWDVAEQAFENGLVAAREIGERRVELDILSFRRSMHLLRARHEILPEVTSEHVRIASETGDVQHSYMSRIGHAELALRLMNTETADHWLHDARDRLVQAFASDHFLAMAPTAAVYHLQGRTDEAWHLARAQVETAGKKPPVGYYAVEPYWHVTGVLLDLLARGTIPGGASQSDVARVTARALAGFRSLAKCFPVTRPRADVMAARHDRLRGQTRRAEKRAMETVALAQTMQMPMEEAMAHAELSRNPTLAPDVRSKHRNRAETLFKSIEMVRTSERLGDDIAPLHG